MALLKSYENTATIRKTVAVNPYSSSALEVWGHMANVALRAQGPSGSRHSRQAKA